MQRLGCGQRGGQAAGGAAVHHPIRYPAGLELAAQFGVALLAVFLFSGGQGQSSPVNNVMGTGGSKEASGGAASALSASGRACIKGCS